MPYLREIGWIRSRRGRLPVDADGHPLPWYTYPAIHFLGLRVPPTARVFEFGCGQSTLWWADHVEHVTAVEHEARWAARMRPALPTNATLIEIGLSEDGDYCRAAGSSGDGPFDVIVVDGRDRANCVRQSVEQITPEGVIVLDNANRGRYRQARNWIVGEGFAELPFRGNAPRGARLWDTTVFYRPGNCLGL